MSSNNGKSSRRSPPLTLPPLEPTPRTSFVFTSSRYSQSFNPDSVSVNDVPHDNDNDSDNARPSRLHHSSHRRNASLSLQSLQHHATGAADAKTPPTPLPEGFVYLTSANADSPPPAAWNPIPTADRPLWIPPMSSAQRPNPPTSSLSPSSSTSMEPDSYFPRVLPAAESISTASNCSPPSSPSASALPLPPIRPQGRPVRQELSLTELLSSGNDIFGRPRSMSDARDGLPKVKPQARPLYKPSKSSKSNKKHGRSLTADKSAPIEQDIDVIDELKKSLPKTSSKYAEDTASIDADCSDVEA